MLNLQESRERKQLDQQKLKTCFYLMRVFEWLQTISTQLSLNYPKSLLKTYLKSTLFNKNGGLEFMWGPTQRNWHKRAMWLELPVPTLWNLGTIACRAQGWHGLSRPALCCCFLSLLFLVSFAIFVAC